MVRRVVFLALVAMLSLSFSSMAERIDEEEAFSIIDDMEYLPREYREIICGIQEFKFQYGKNEIASMIIASHYALNTEDVDKKVYDVASGIARFTDDNLGLDFMNLVNAYVRSQSKDISTHRGGDL